MKAKDLIEKLKALDPETEIYTYTGCQECDFPEPCTDLDLAMNVRDPKTLKIVRGVRLS